MLTFQLLLYYRIFQNLQLILYNPGFIKLVLSNWHYITKVPFDVPDYKRKFLKNTYPFNILCTALLIFYCSAGDFLKEESKRTLQFARTFLRQILKIFKGTVRKNSAVCKNLLRQLLKIFKGTVKRKSTCQTDFKVICYEIIN